MKQRILITGGNGYVAKSLYKYLQTKYDITVITRNDFDLTDRLATNTYFSDKIFDCVIHTAIKGGSRLHIDDDRITHENLSMFYNLWNNKHKFERLINFGSGAEDGMPTSPYGLSKNIISKLIKQIPNFYNLRIFAVFDENELDTRFIKGNIKRYLNKEEIIIHQNKLMDFFYMKDLVTLVNYYIKENHLPKVAECSYDKKYSLLDIAHLINNLSDYKTPIKQLDPTEGKAYIGKTLLDLNYIGLEQGIKEVYNKLQNEY